MSTFCNSFLLDGAWSSAWDIPLVSGQHTGAAAITSEDVMSGLLWELSLGALLSLKRALVHLLAPN